MIQTGMEAHCFVTNVVEPCASRRRYSTASGYASSAFVPYLVACMNVAATTAHVYCALQGHFLFSIIMKLPFFSCLKPYSYYSGCRGS